jgi:hypothetical protein
MEHAQRCLPMLLLSLAGQSQDNGCLLAAEAEQAGFGAKQEGRRAGQAQRHHGFQWGHYAAEPCLRNHQGAGLFMAIYLARRAGTLSLSSNIVFSTSGADTQGLWCFMCSRG